MLAGGRSLRFGRDKLVEPYRGRPVLEHAVRRIAQLCDDVVVVLAPGRAPPETLPGVPVRFARDPVEGQGPLVGAVAGLRVAAGELAVLVGGDMPDPSLEVLGEMVRRAERTGADAVVLRDGPRLRPLPSVVRPARAVAAGSRMLKEGERRLRVLIEMLGPAEIDESRWRAIDPEGRTLFDVDEPDDLGR